MSDKPEIIAEATFQQMVENLIKMIRDAEDMPPEFRPDGASVVFINGGKYYTLELREIEEDSLCHSTDKPN